MAEEREQVYVCETCMKPLYLGDQFQAAGECNFCPEHAATLGEILEFWEGDLANCDAAFAAWSDAFDSIEDLEQFIERLRTDITMKGADHKPLTKV